MQEFLLETNIGRSLRWVALLILLAIPLTQIVSQLHSEITKERGVFGIEQATPIEQKTPLGRILQAIDTKNDISESRAIFGKEKNQLPPDVTAYLDKFYNFYDQYSNNFSVLADISPYSHLITGAGYIRDYMEAQNAASRSYYRAFEVVPFTFMKMAYRADVITNGLIYRGQLLDLCDQYQKTIVVPLDNISGHGATVFCIMIRLQYQQALGILLRRDKTEQLKQIGNQIDDYKAKYPNSLGKNGNLKTHIRFLDSYKESADSITKKDGFLDRAERYFLGSGSDPIAKIPGIDS